MNQNINKICLADGERFIFQTKDPFKNSFFVLTIFWITLLFQSTVLKYIFAIKDLSTFLNGVVLILTILYSFYFIVASKYNINVWYFYIFPCLFVFIGMFLNTLLNVINNPHTINYFGNVAPWAIYLTMPILMKKNNCDSETLWRYFYYFMLTVIVLGLLDYFLVFSGRSSPRMISTQSYGDYLAGWFSVFYISGEDAGPQPRLCGCFSEPGTLAMFVLPAIAYAYFNKKYIGLIILMIGLYFSNSFGGIIGITMLLFLILFVSINKKGVPWGIILFVLIFVSSVFVMNFMGDFIQIYEEKNVSKYQRVNDFENTLKNMHLILLNNPLGFELTKGSMSNSENELYFGSTFTIGNAAKMGGISSFIGYVFVLLVSLAVAFVSIIKRNLSIEEKVVFCSIIIVFPFIFQRNSLWDSPIFAFLFVPSIIRVLQSHGDV